MIRIVPPIFATLISSHAFAETYCARPSGSGNGSDWNNAIALSTVTTSSEFRGDTIYVSGESFGGMTWTAPASGTQYITIKKATVDDHVTDVGWDESWGTNQASFHNIKILTAYWAIDGQVGGGYGSYTSGHGIYIGTGGSGKMLKFYNNWNTEGTASAGLRLSHIEFEGAWDGDGVGERNDAIAILARQSDIRVDHCYIHNTGRTAWLSQYTDNVLIEDSYFANNESLTEDHSEPIAIQGGDDWIIRNNYFFDVSGTGAAVVFKKNQSPWTNDSYQIYGNVVDTSRSSGHGVFADTHETTANNTDVKIYNNTIHNLSGHRCGTYFTGSTNTVYTYNNVWFDNKLKPNGYPIVFDFIGSTHDYNWYYQNNGEDETLAADETNGMAGTFDPFTDYEARDWTLSDGVEGLNLPSLGGSWVACSGNARPEPGDSCIDVNDPAGKIRGGDGIWDRGAFEFDGVIPDPTCHNQGHRCCNACQSGAEQSSYDADCLGQVCCSACELTGGLLVHLTFDDDLADSKAMDSSGNAFHATCTACPSYASGGGFDGSGAYQFDNTDDFLEIDLIASQLRDYPFTFAAWIKTDSSDYDSIVTMADSSQDLQYFDMQKYDDARPVAVVRTDSSFDPASATTTVNDGEWHHIAAVFESSTNRKIFSDGSNMGENTVEKPFITTIDNLNIGRLGRSSGGNYFAGLMDDVRIYDTALSLSEIQDLASIEQCGNVGLDEICCSGVVYQGDCCGDEDCPAGHSCVDRVCQDQSTCPDTTCDEDETCSSCPQDCHIESTEVCCSGVIYLGECCGDADCSVDESCLGYECLPTTCSDGDTADCYLGPAGTEDFGICEGGRRTCSTGSWGECEGEIVPEPTEACDNEKDDDCDGEIDESCGTIVVDPPTCNSSGASGWILLMFGLLLLRMRRVVLLRLRNLGV